MTAGEIIGTITVDGVTYDVRLGDTRRPVGVWWGDRCVAHFLAAFMEATLPAAVWDSGFLLAVGRLPTPPTHEIRSQAIATYRAHVGAPTTAGPTTGSAVPA